MKSIMLSINPKWIAKIMNGEKTIEARNTCPKDFKQPKAKPIDVLMYCTKRDLLTMIYGEACLTKYTTEMSPSGNVFRLNGKVVAKFTLDRVEEIKVSGVHISGSGYSTLYFSTDTLAEEDLLKKSCLSYLELADYLGYPVDSDNVVGYAWHISNLVIFDKPKELSEFGLKRAPESWQYVEVE